MTIAEYSYPVLVLWFYCSKDFLIIWLSNLSALSMPDEGYYRNYVMHTKFDDYVFILTLGTILVLSTMEQIGLKRQVFNLQSRTRYMSCS